MGENNTVDITIPCGGKDPPYTYTYAGSFVVAYNIHEYFVAINQYQSNNEERYCCNAMGETICYQLNITCTLNYIV